MSKANKIIPKFMVENPKDVFAFLMPLNLHVDYEDLANCQFNVLINNLTKKEQFLEKISPEIFFSHFGFGKIYQNGKLAPYQNTSIHEVSYKIDTSSLLHEDIALGRLLNSDDIRKLLSWKNNYSPYAKNLHCSVVKQDNATIIIPHYAIASYYYFRNTKFREAAFRCKLNDLYITSTCDEKNASILVPHYVNENEAMLIHRFACQETANKGFENIGKYILSYLRDMKEKRPTQNIEYIPIKATFPVDAFYNIDTRVSEFDNEILGRCVYVHEILNDTSPIGFTNFTVQKQIANIKTEIDRNSAGTPQEDPSKNSETLERVPATKGYKPKGISPNKDQNQKCGSLLGIPVKRETITDEEIKTIILKIYQTSDSETPIDQGLTESSVKGSGKVRKIYISSLAEDFIMQITPTEYTHNFDEFNQYMAHTIEFKEIENLQVNDVQKIKKINDEKADISNKKSTIDGRERQYITATFRYKESYVGLLELENKKATSTWVISSKKNIDQSIFDSFLNLYIKNNKHVNDIKTAFEKNKTTSFKTKNHERSSNLTPNDLERWISGMLSKVKHFSA